MQSGIIRQISRYQGLGFIRNDTGNDVFFHRSEVKGKAFDLLKRGQRVNFNIGLRPRGFLAMM